MAGFCGLWRGFAVCGGVLRFVPGGGFFPGRCFSSDYSEILAERFGTSSSVFSGIGQRSYVCDDGSVVVVLLE